MNRFGLGHLTNQKDARDQAESSILYMNQNGQFNKKNAVEFLDAIHTQLTSSETSPISKTMTLHMLKQLTYQTQVKFFSLLMSHQTLNFLYHQAKTIDPKKNLNQKGLKKFPNSPQLGRQYMRVLLQLTNFWGEKFAKGGNSQTTKFKKNLTQLKNLGIILPSNYEYFDPNQYKLRSKRSKDGASSPPPSLPTNPQGNNILSKLGLGNSSAPIPSSLTPKSAIGSKLTTQLKYTKDKVNIFVADLQQAQDPDRIQTLIQTNHVFFQKQRNKYQARAAQVQNDEQAITNYFPVQHFLNEENNFYMQYIPVNDFQSYIAQIKMVYQSTFEKQSPKNQSLTQNKTLQNQVIKPMKPTQSKLVAQSKLAGLATGLSQTFAVTQTKTRSPINNQPPRIDSKAIINNFYSKIAQRSLSPHSGFKAVQNELQKQKQLAKKNPVRKTSRSPRNLSRSNDGNLSRSNATNLRQSKIHPIFTSPPNRNVNYKNFQGDTLLQNKELVRALYGIKKDQGSRRFKISNFRQKNPLFQNQQIQVGYKSQAVYQTIGDFNHFILINLFIGNKTEDGIKQFQVEYKADQNQVLYANPRNVDTIIPAGYQNKHDLLITPLTVPYTLMNMHISYRFKDTGYMTSIILPNSVLKFASYMKISQSDFQKNWKNSMKLKTNPFRLCRHLAPDSFNRWIPVLQYITKYSQFSKQGSQIDLQMFCMAIMLQKYEAVLKINIRPNLDVVLQLGVLDNNQQGLEYFKFYLETLELILKDIDV